MAALPAGLLAQTNVQDSCVQANLVLVEAGIGLPQADLADRFGYHGLAGAGWQFKSDKNLLFGLSGHYYFGDRVKKTACCSICVMTMAISLAMTVLCSFLPSLNRF